MFFLSGFCGLLYQIVWLRKAFAVFGVITPAISVVVSVFMLGLFIGSWGAGRWISAFSRRSSVSPIYVYGVNEFLIAVGGVTVPYLFLLGDRLLLPVGSMDSVVYLLLSAVVVAIAMLPWCIFMGATYPLMMAFLRKHYERETASFSFLYLANVVGAMAGTLLTALVMIEMFGFRNTLFMAAAMNITVSLLSALVGIGHEHAEGAGGSTRVTARKEESSIPESPKGTMPGMVRTILFVTGFSSMGMEVVWTRAFTPALGTLIYSFAALLFTYLLATWLGSYLYRHHRRRKYTWKIPFLVSWLALSSFFPVVFADPRLGFLGRIPVLTIVPICAFLGYLTPKLIDEYSQGDPKRAGGAYAVNIAGCVIGPLFASYLLLPFFGSRVSAVILALPFLCLMAGQWRLSRSASPWNKMVIPALAILLTCSLFVSRGFEDRFRRGKGTVRHDYAATIVSAGSGLDKRLFVNGISITGLTPITKDMAHMPLSLLDHKPQSALAICLGMGTTFRSLASWGIDATAVELVPSVKEAFGYYCPDADYVLSKPNVRIIVDDGRRYLRRTAKKFDVITIDPPPPVQAAGSSLLYSEEFYSLVKSRLTPGGLLQQWIPGGSPATVAAVTTSLTRAFPYVRMYRSIEGWGYHYVASVSPIHVPTVAEALSRMPESARNDRLEWNPTETPNQIWSRLLAGEVQPAAYELGPQMRITDDRPFNEYYWLREEIIPALRKLFSHL
jgi:spermidine synthase